MWDWGWGGPATFTHDELASDKRNPTANAYGPIYGVDWGNDGSSLDMREHTAEETRIPVLDPKTPPGKPQSMPVPSPYWSSNLYWFDPAISNRAAMDSKERVWISARFRAPENQPSFCKDHPSAALAPMPPSFRQIQCYDPTVVADPTFLTQDFVISSQFKKESRSVQMEPAALREFGATAVASRGLSNFCARPSSSCITWRPSATTVRSRGCTTARA
jgi:hypothetical protein